jgi:hypothetical protein
MWLKNPENITIQIPGTDITFTLENVYDEYGYTSDYAYDGPYSKLDSYNFYLYGAASIACNKPLGVSIETWSNYVGDDNMVGYFEDLDAGERIEVSLQSPRNCNHLSVSVGQNVKTAFGASQISFYIFDSNYIPAKITDATHAIRPISELAPDSSTYPPAVSAAPSITARPTSSTVLVNGSPVAFDAYNINDYNYFKLRDIGAALDFGVDWDGERNTIVIDTDKGYTQEN